MPLGSPSTCAACHCPLRGPETPVAGELPAGSVARVKRVSDNERPCFGSKQGRSPDGRRPDGSLNHAKGPIVHNQRPALRSNRRGARLRVHKPGADQSGLGQIVAHMVKRASWANIQVRMARSRPTPAMAGGMASATRRTTTRGSITRSPTRSTSRLAATASTASFQALRFGDPFPGDIIEETILPFTPDLHGNVSVSVSDINI